MSYTFSDQQSKLSFLLGDPNTSSEDMFPLATRKKELNRGELQFSLDAKNLREYASGTVASNEISIPSDWLETFLLIVGSYQITNNREVSLKDYERYSAFSGMPPYYYFWEFSGTRKIKFFGSATGQAYYLYYFKKPTTELSSDSDVSLHPEEYREGPVYYAASELLKSIGKHQESSIFRAYYDSLVQKAKEEVQRSYINKELAVPDLGNDYETYSTDISGRSYPG